MKKTLFRIIALALLVCTLVLTLASCVKPQLNFDKAKAALEKAKYTVSIEEDKDDLEPGVAKSLTARWVNESDSSDYEYLYISEFKTAKMAQLSYEAMKQSIDSEIEQIELQIETYEYMLKKFDADMDSEEIDELNDEIKDLKDELEEYDEYVVGISGKIVWYGTEKAAKASKDK